MSFLSVYRFERNLNASFTASAASPRNVLIMRWAFVLQLAAGTSPPHQHIEGWIEEVDTGPELRFHSSEELLKFLCMCFETARRDPLDAGDADDAGSGTED